MNRSVRLFRVVMPLLGLIAATAAGGADAPRGAERRFELGKYVKGTPTEIRQMLQGPVDEFTEKTKDAKRRAAEREAALAKAKEGAAGRVRQSPQYQKLATDAAAAEASLEQLRRSGTAKQRLDASTRLNRFRASMEKMDKDAVAKDPEVARQTARLAEERESVVRCEQSLEKATAWRDQWVYAIECTFRFNAPLDAGEEAVLTVVKVLKPHGAGQEGVLVEYEAPEQTGLGKEIEGIQHVNVVMQKHRLLLGPVTPGAAEARPGQTLELFRTYRIEGMTTDADGPVYVAARKPADADALMAEIMPMRVTETPEAFRAKEKGKALPAEARQAAGNAAGKAGGRAASRREPRPRESGAREAR